MKTKALSFFLLTYLPFIFLCKSEKCQTQIGSITFNYWGETRNMDLIDAFGIGDFTANGDLPKAGLDVHMPYLYNGGLVNPGEAFHTYLEQNYFRC